MRHLVGHKGAVRAVTFTPAGHVVSGGQDGSVRVWDVPSGECAATAKHRGPVYAVAAAPGKAEVAFAGRHSHRNAWQAVTRFDLVSGEVAGWCQLPRLTGYAGELDRDTGQINSTSWPITRSVWALTYSADGRHLAGAVRRLGGGNVPNGDGAYVWRVDGRGGYYSLDRDDVYAVQFAAAGDGLAVTGRNAVIVCASRPLPGRPPPASVELRLPAQWAAPVLFVPPGDRIAVAAGRYIYLFGLGDPATKRRVKTGLAAVSALAAMPDGRTVVAGGRPRGIEVYDASTGGPGPVYDFGVGHVHALAAAPDGLTVAVAGADGLVVVDADW